MELVQITNRVAYLETSQGQRSVLKAGHLRDRKTLNIDSKKNSGRFEVIHKHVPSLTGGRIYLCFQAIFCRKEPSCLFPVETKKRNSLLSDVKQKLLLTITLIWDMNYSEYCQIILIRYHDSDLGKQCVNYTSVTH